jgi:ribonucleoside-triphosphate reductase
MLKLSNKIYKQKGFKMKEIREYLRKTDLTYDNANQNWSFSALKESVTKARFTEYTKHQYLMEVPDAIRLHDDGDIYIHDFWCSSFIPYCAGWDLRKILLQGINFRNITANPPKHLNTVLSQTMNTLCVLQEEFAGAMAFNNFDLYLAPYIKYDNLSQKMVNQLVQSFVWDCNYPTRAGSQSPFLNITLTMGVPEDFASMGTTIGDYTYSDLEREIEMVDTAIFKELKRGDAKGRPFGFPIPTININKEFDWDRDIVDELMRLTALKGSPLFLTTDNKNLLSMCCRLNLDLDQMNDYGGGLWSVGDSTGSIGIVSLNLPRIGIESKGSLQVAESLISYYLDIASEYLMYKRKMIKDTYSRGLMEGSRFMLGDRGFKFHFNTIGVIGGHEMLQNMGFKTGIMNKRGRIILEHILQFIRDELIGLQQRDGVLYNLEQTPAETAAAKLALRDREIYGNGHYGIKNGDVVEYTNSTHIPVDANVEITDKIKIEGSFHKLFNGGCISHIFLNELSNTESMKTFTKLLKDKSDLVYFSYTPTISVCEKCKKSFVGVFPNCINCGNKTQIYTRVVGYYSPVDNWNSAKKEEFKSRKRWKI